MNKTLIFDMDGTLADFYNVPGWLEYLEREETTPYEVAAPLCNMVKLSAIVRVLQGSGYTVKVVSWGAGGASAEYNRRIRKVKKEWLDRYNFPYDELHVVKYGTPKQKYIKGEEVAILFDDNREVRQEFIKSRKAGEKKAVDVLNQAILEELIKILLQEE